MSSVFGKYGLLRQRLLLGSRTECQHFLHPWCQSCTQAAIGLAIACAIFSFKIYPIVYLIGFLTKQKLPTKQDIYRLLVGITTSTAFLTFTGFSYSLQMCFFRKLLGHFNYGSITLLPMFLTSLMAIELERDSRKTALALYVANLATETVWNMAKSRHLVRDLPFANTLIFSVSTAVLLCFTRCFPRDFFLSYVKKLKGSRNDSCNDHNSNCSRYILKTCFKHFWIGYGISAVTQTIFKLNIRKLFATKNFRLASFFASYPLIYNVIVCGWGKWSDSRSLPQVNSNLLKFGAALLAGTSFQLVANTTVSLYMFWKMLHILSLFAVAKKLLKPHRKYPILLYSICTAILFHVAVFEPHNLRRTYWKFLNDTSGRRIATMDRTFIEQLWQPNLKRNLNASMKAIGYDSQVINYRIGKIWF